MPMSSASSFMGVQPPSVPGGAPQRVFKKTSRKSSRMSNAYLTNRLLSTSDGLDADSRGMPGAHTSMVPLQNSTSMKNLQQKEKSPLQLQMPQQRSTSQPSSGEHRAQLSGSTTSQPSPGQPGQPAQPAQPAQPRQPSPGKSGQPGQITGQVISTPPA